MHFQVNIKHFSFLALALCCLVFGNIVAQADDLRLRDGTIIKADAVWERDNVIWYRQGQVIRSIPMAEVLRGAELAKAIEPTPSVNSTWKKSSRRFKQPIDNTSENKPVASTLVPDTNAKPVNRIIFKDGVQLDADAIWEMGDRVGYRLGNMQAFIDKEVVAQVLKDAVPAASTKAEVPSLAFTTRHAGLDQLIVANAARHDVDPLLIYLVMQQESGFNHRAVSRVGARGLMQLMPGTARQLGVRNIHDPVENVEAGTRYLKSLLLRFAGDVNLALAAYNAGEEAVARYGNRVPPYRETINYVRRISWAYHQFKK